MSSKYKSGQFADPRGIVVQGPTMDFGMVGEGATVPTDGTAGYEEGCLWLKRSSTALSGGQLYVNEGSVTSCDFNALTTRESRMANNLVAVPAATTTLTLTPAAHDGRIVLLQSTGGLVVTPPAATGTGGVYRFLVLTTISGGNVTIDAKAGNASDVFLGRAYQLKVGTSEIVYAAGATDNLITLDGSTRGGIAGDAVTMIDMGTNKWYVTIDETGSGTVATPFSNH